MRWFQDLARFLRELVVRSWFWVSGLASLLSFVLDYFLPGWPFPTWLPWLVLAIGFIMGTFDLWREKTRQVRQLETCDADIGLEPMKDPARSRFKLPDSYQLVPNLVPSRIWLLVNFLVINRGGEASGIVFRRAGIFPHFSQEQWDRHPLDLPLILGPNEHKQITFLLSATITERDPAKFAEQFGKLSTFRITFGWAFSGRDVDRQDEVKVEGIFTNLKSDVFANWRQYGRDDLIKIAEQHST